VHPRFDGTPLEQLLDLVLRSDEQIREAAGEFAQVEREPGEEAELLDRVASLSSSSARPRASSCSRVRAWTPKARVMLLVSCCRRSRTVTESPAAARSPASSKPVGPAPTTMTSAGVS
jgi:hypothetical protein